ncbi:hypothetical protein HY641_02800 [Candidatus Woesearchaeota archaeon]|nr:hypothetical protein [Candidatus Woesearchaeota archaeon]
MNKISELQANQGKIEVEGTIIALKPPRTFNRFGKEGKVRNGTLKDDSGEMEISLWNEQADQVNAGDAIKISNGWVSEYQGKLQISTGKFGKLDILEKGAIPTVGASPLSEKPTVPPKPVLVEEDVNEPPRKEFDYGVTDDQEGLDKERDEDSDDISIEEENFD